MPKTVVKIDSELLERLRKLAAEHEPLPDDWNPMDYSGGNFDDAWGQGYDQGEQCLAKMITESIDEEE